MSVTKREHISFLKSQLAQFERELAEAEANVERLRARVANVKATVEILAEPGSSNGSQALYKGLEASSEQPGDPPRSAPKSKKKEKKPKAATLITTRTLQRQPEFEQISTTTALKQILNATPTAVHYGELMRKIFVIGGEEDSLRAKRSLSSQLSDGVQKGYWQALGEGLYKRVET